MYASPNSIKALLKTEIEFRYQQNFFRDVSIGWALLTLGGAERFNSRRHEKIKSDEFIMEVSCGVDMFRRVESINISASEADSFLVIKNRKNLF